MKLWIYLFFGFFCLSIQAQTDLDLAESYYDNGEFKKALHLYKILQSTQPNNSKYTFRLIKILQELEQFKADIETPLIIIEGISSATFCYIYNINAY